MSLSQMLIIALALSVDALVCSIITGKSSCNNISRLITGFTVAFSFGLFQFLMPILGFLGGKQLQETLAAFDHWIAFLLLFGVGANMLKEAYSSYREQQADDAADDEDGGGAIKDCNSNHLLQVSLIALLSMAIGTSIDALAVGVSYGLVSDAIMLCASIIGIVCFICSLLGYFLGQVLSTFKAIDPILNLLGAVVLISIGVNILLEHQALEQITKLMN